MIAVVDYGLGNLASVRNAFRTAGAEVVVTSDREILERSDGVVLPGVGAAAAGMARLRERELDGPVKDLAERGRPLFGICLGMQLLFERSEEGDAEGLGLIGGRVRRLRGGEKIPHIGWNEVRMRSGAPLWSELPDNPYFYFVHSYVCEPADGSVAAGTTEYGEPFCSALERGTIWGTQFHPERSGEMGRRLIRNFIRVCIGGANCRP